MCTCLCCLHTNGAAKKVFWRVSGLDGKVLPGDLTHYVVPDVGVVDDFLEILEFRELQGIIFTQTACQAVQHSKGRRCPPHFAVFISVLLCVKVSPEGLGETCGVDQGRAHYIKALLEKSYKVQPVAPT